MKQLLTIITLALLIGCAGVKLTPEETTIITLACKDDAICMVAATDKALADKVEQLEYEREDRRIIKRDKLIAFLNACDASEDLAILEKIYIRSHLSTDRQIRKALKEYDYKYTHDNVSRKARRQDFHCVDPRQIRQ